MIKPCPFCNDQMKLVRSYSDQVGHAVNDNCFLHGLKFPIDRWNERAEIQEKTVMYRPILRDKQLKQTFGSDYLYDHQTDTDHKYFDYDLLGWEVVEMIANATN